jgi:hypothetical protein
VVVVLVIVAVLTIVLSVFLHGYGSVTSNECRVDALKTMCVYYGNTSDGPSNVREDVNGFYVECFDHTASVYQFNTSVLGNMLDNVTVMS